MLQASHRWQQASHPLPCASFAPAGLLQRPAERLCGAPLEWQPFRGRGAPRNPFGALHNPFGALRNPFGAPRNPFGALRSRRETAPVEHRNELVELRTKPAAVQLAAEETRLLSRCPYATLLYSSWRNYVRSRPLCGCWRESMSRWSDCSVVS